MAIEERDILIWLNTLEIGNKNIRKIMEYCHDLKELLDSSKYINSIDNITDNVKSKIINNLSVNIVQEKLQSLKDKEIHCITILDKDYPPGLKNIFDRPKVLYKKGDFKAEDELSIGIVGSRKATSYGEWACEKFTKELINMGVTIVSGVALGIDAIAHRTAIIEGGRTIGVLGNGIDTIYPKRNRSLYDEIPKQGLILTEFPPGTQPLAYNFPQRNRIISGLSLGIIVIEAKEKSGSLITAHHALEQGKDVFALPGNINSIFSGGTNKLIKDGARPLLDIDDIIEEIHILKEIIEQQKVKTIDYKELSETEIKIIKTLENGPTHYDTIVYKTGIDASNLGSILTILELKGIIKGLSGRMFIID